MSPPSSALRGFLVWRRPSVVRRMRESGEAGFTLIELAIVLVILPLVIGAVAIALIAMLQDQTGISTRISDSVDSQITSAFFVRDVQSAQYVTKAATPGASPWTHLFGPAKCGSGTSSNFVVSLAWSRGGGASPETVVSYWKTQLAPSSGTATGSTSGAILTSTTAVFNNGLIGQGIVQTTGTSSIPTGTTVKNVLSPTQAKLSGGVTGGPIHFVVGPKLVRDLCNGSATPTKVTTSRDFFSPFTHAVVSCVKGHTAPTCSTPTSHKTVSNQWTATFAVSSVTLTVAEPAGKYNYYVSASPRVSNGKGSSFGTCVGAACFPPSLPTLLLLGGFHVITETSGHTKITVVGTAVLNTGYLKMVSGSTFTVVTKTPTRGRIRSSLPTPTTVCLSRTAQCSTPPTATVHPWPPTKLPAPLPDPLAGLADPGPAATSPNCHGTTLDISTTVTLTPGQFKNCGLHVKANGKVTLNPGLYEFDTGITLTGGASLNGTSGVLIYFPCNASVNGNHVDTWAPTCNEQMKIKNSTITAKRISTGPYAGLLWFWQNQGDTKPFTMSGNTNSMVAHGVLYDAGGPVTLTGLGTSKTPVGAIISSALTVSNSNIVVIGP